MNFWQRIQSWWPLARSKTIFPMQGMGSWTTAYGGNTRGNRRLSDLERLRANFGVVRRAALRCADDIAVLGVQVKRPSRPDSGTLVVDADHPLARLIATPAINSPYQTKHDLVHVTIQHLKLLGRAAWLVVEDSRGIPRELHVLQPDRLEALPHETLFVARYRYQSLNGKTLYLAAYHPRMPSPDGVSVLELRIPDPGNPYGGNSDVQGASADIALNAEIKSYAQHFFANNATPAGVLESDQPYPGAETSEALHADFNEKFQGSINAGKVARLWNGLKFKPLSQPFKDLQYPELTKASIEQVALSFGVPLSVMGYTPIGQLGGNAAEAERRSYEASTLDPLRVRLEAAFNQLAPRFGPGVSVAVDSPVAQDWKLEREERRWQLEHGVISKNEYRQAEGLEPDGHPDFYLLPHNYAVVTQVNPATEPTVEQQLTGQFRALFASEYKRVKTTGLNDQLEAELAEAWPFHLRQASRLLRRTALERANHDPALAYEALKAEGARLMAQLDLRQPPKTAAQA